MKHIYAASCPIFRLFLPVFDLAISVHLPQYFRCEGGLRMARILIAQFEQQPSIQMAAMFIREHHAVVVCPPDQPVLKQVQQDNLGYDLVVLDISMNPEAALKLVKQLRQFRIQHGPRPKVLCVSQVLRPARFKFELEQEGARLSMYVNMSIIIEEAEFMLLQLARLVSRGPRITIIHRFGQIGLGCHSGEEVAAVYLEDQEEPLPLQLVLRLLLDYLGRHRHIPLSATQIATGISTERFYTEHGGNSGVISRRKVTRSAIKTYMTRCRAALNDPLERTSLGLSPREVLVSRETMGNEARYQLRADVEWVHIDDLEIQED
jgi:CheY-like chemotaxis protein